MNNLEGVKVKDRVWSSRFGWGTVVDIDHFNLFGLYVEFDNKSIRKQQYTPDGCAGDPDNEYPTLFFEMPKFYKDEDYPTKPRKRVRKGTSYYFITITGEIEMKEESNTKENERMFEVGNYFMTEEEAIKSEIFRAFYYTTDEEGENNE